MFVVVRQGKMTEQDDWSYPFVRLQRLNLEQSLLIAILRQHFIAHIQKSGTGVSQALVAVDELIPQLQVYLVELDSEAVSTIHGWYQRMLREHAFDSSLSTRPW